jgi:hypothetical protein
VRSETKTRWEAWWGLVLALGLCAPSLTLGMGWDEFIRLSVLEGAAPEALPWRPLQLSRFARGTPEELAELSRGIHEGFIPWGCVPQPGKLMYFRPLASASTGLDHTLFGLAPFGYHLHAVVLFLALVGVLAVFYRRVLPAETVAGLRFPTVAGLALFIFIGDPTHLEVLQRVTCREYLVAGLFGLLGLLAHLSWRQGRWAAARFVSPLCFALAFLAGEMALQVVTFLVAYECLAGPGGWRRRVAALVPVGLVVAAVVLHFKLGGYGATVYGYQDPTADLGAWFAVAPRVFTELMLEAVVGLPRILFLPYWPAHGLDLAVPYLKARPWELGAAAVLVFGTLGWLLRDAASGSLERRNTGWLVAGSVLALLPVLRENGTPRLLFLPSIGFSAVLALALDAWLRRLRAAWARRDRSRLRRIPVVLVGVLACVWGALLLLGGPASTLRQLLRYREVQPQLDRFLFFREGTRLATDPWVRRTPVLASGPEETLVLGAPYESVHWPLYSEFVRVVDEDGQRVRVKHLSFLSTARSDHELLRTAEDTFQLSLAEAPAFPWAKRLYFPWFDSLQVCPLSVSGLHPTGARVETRTLSIQVQEVVDGDRYRRIEVTRKTPEDSTWFAVWRQGELHRVRLPALGQRLRIPLDIEPPGAAGR